MKAISGIRDNRGYTIVEMLIAAGIVMFVLAGVYGVYITMHQSNQTSKATLEMQQNVRVTMDDITRLLTMSGYQGDCKESHAHGIVYKRDPADNINAPPKSDVISNAHSVGFTYWDEAYKKIKPIGCDPERRMRIYLDSSNHRVLCEEETFYNNGGVKGFKLYPETPVVLARNIDNLTFRYYNKVGDEIAPADLVTQATLVRKVTVTVTGRTSLKDLVAGNVKVSDYNFSLTSQVSPANLGLEGHSVDTIPPSVPTGLAISDPHICGRVNVSWNANPEVDLDHYTLYYGPETGKYDHRVDVSKGNTNYTITGLPDAPVFVSISATDASGNSSDKSAEVTLTPVADKPSAAPVNFRASAGSTDGQIILQWDKHPDPDVTYYLIYRKEIPDPDHVTPFTYPTPGSSAGVTTIAGSQAVFDSKVTKTGSGYVLIDSGLKGCVMYDYTICPVVECRYDLVSTYTSGLYSRVYGDGHDKGYPSVGPTRCTVPTDSNRPADPIGLVGIPGDQKNYLSWTNPNDQDLKGVVIVRSTTGFPAAPTDGTVVSDDTTDGPGASCSFVDGKTDTDTRQTGVPLENGMCYYYTAFSYDKCGNYSAGLRSRNKNGDIAPDCSMPCGDGIVGSPEFGPPPPPPPSGFKMSICAQDYSVSKVNMGWSDAVPLPEDCLGYNVYRSDQGENPIRFYYKNPGAYNIYTDVDYPSEGAIYTYWVRTVDCADNLNVEDTANPRVELTAYPGKVAYDSAVQTSLRGPYRNVVRFNSKNTSMKQAKITGMTLTWSGKNVENTAYLSEIWLGPSVTGQIIYSSSGIRPGVEAYLSPPTFLPEATDSTHPSSTMFSFVFRTADGKESSAVDMSGTTITIQYDYSLYYYNSFLHNYVETDQSLNTSCTPVTYTIMTPVGPTVNEVTQSQPLVGTFAETKTGMVVVPPDQTTDVSAYVTDTSDTMVGMKSVKLFYAFTNRTTTAPPTVGSVPDGINRAVFTAMTTYPIGTGNYKQYKTSYGGSGHAIPALNDKRIWYFILAEDNDSNFTRWPSPAEPDKNFNYDELQSSGAGSVSTQIVYPAMNATVSGTITVTIQATTSVGSITYVQYKVDNGTWSPANPIGDPNLYTASLNTTLLSEGQHTITAQAVASGSSSTATSTFTVQNSSVTCRIISPASGASIKGQYTIQVQATSSSAPISSVQINIDGGSWIGITQGASGYYEYVWNTKTGSVTDGTHVINAKATDGTSTTYSSVIFTVNNAGTQVNVNILAPSADATVSGTTTVVVNASTNGLGFGLSSVTIKVDNGSEQACSLRMDGPYQGYWTYDLDTTALTYGSHTIRVTASDLDGTSTMVTRNVLVDNTLVTVNIIKPVAGASVSGTSVLIRVYAATDGQAISTVSYKINSGSWKTMTYNPSTKFYEATWNTATYSNGSYTLTAMAVTTGGAHTGTSQPVNVTVANSTDLVAPAVTVDHMVFGKTSPITIGPPVPAGQSLTENKTVTWYVNATDSGFPTSGVKTVYCNDNQAGSADQVMTLSGGYYVYSTRLPNVVGSVCVYKFRAVDNAGNVSDYTSTYTITTTN